MATEDKVTKEKTAVKKLRAVKPRPMPDRQVNPKKSEGFAIGVTPSHYWMVTALAAGRKSNRRAILEEVIDFYIQNKLAANP